MRHLHHHSRVLVLIFAFAVSLIAPLGATAHSIDDSGTSVRITNAAIAADLFESVLNGHDADAAARLVAADAVIVAPDRIYTGPRGLMGYLATIRRTYPGSSFAVTSYNVLQDGSVVLRWTLTGSRYLVDTHEAPFNTLVSMTGETTIAVNDGQIAAMVHAPGDVAFLPQAEITLVRGNDTALIGGHVVWA